MPFTTVRAVSSLPVAGAKMALSVHTWLTKHKQGPQIVSVIFHCLHTENAILLLPPVECICTRNLLLEISDMTKHCLNLHLYLEHS